ncbi:MAG: hypothetical protein FWG54_04530 [Bacteroidetes bacterium]|nr:hypothetical protein [Bacteroidota bacterium]
MKTRICIILALFGGMTGCLEREQPVPGGQIIENPFGLFVIHLTLIDYDTKEPIPDLSIIALSAHVRQLDIEEEPSDEEGVIHVSLVAAPPTPQQFILSCIYADSNRPFSNDFIVVRFSNPIFVYYPKDAALLGKWYQGTAELSLTQEIRRIVYE